MVSAMKRRMGKMLLPAAAFEMLWMSGSNCLVFADTGDVVGKRDSQKVSGSALQMALEDALAGVQERRLIVFICAIAAGLGILCAVLLYVSRKKKEKQAGEDALGNSGCGEHMGQAGSIADFEGVTEEDGLGQLYVGKLHNIGKRSSQQDSFGISCDGDRLDTSGKGILAVVADGMGGMENGGQISALATMTMLEQFDRRDAGEDGSQMLLELVNIANDQVNVLQSNARAGAGGSTIVSVFIQIDRMYWLTIGDSHLYLCRKDALLQINQDHVYAVELDERAARGEISSYEAASDPQRKALTSYIGMGKLKRIDRNIHPVKLKRGDRILMMSDGVFGTLSEEEILAAMRLPVKESGTAMDQMIRNKDKEAQDNYTAVILEYI